MREDSLELGMAIVSSLESDEAGRKVLTCFAEGVAYANELGSDVWAVTHSKNWGPGGFLCLYVGSLAHLVGCVGPEGKVGPNAEGKTQLEDTKSVWLALGPLAEASALAKGAMEDPNVWGLTYPEGFKRFGSCVGYYGITDAHDTHWPNVFKAWQLGLRNAAGNCPPLKSDYMPLHLSQVVERLASISGIGLPQPTYLDAAGQPIARKVRQRAKQAKKHASKQLTRPAKLAPADLALFDLEAGPGDHELQSVLEGLRAGLKGDVLRIDSESLKLIEDYVGSCLDPDRRSQLQALLEKLRAPVEGAFKVGDAVQHEAYGRGEVLYCMSGFPKAKVQFAHGVEKILVSELEAAAPDSPSTP